MLFLLLSLLGVRELLMKAISPSMRNAIAVGIGLFIAFIGLQDGLAGASVDGGVSLNPQFASPDLIVFFSGCCSRPGCTPAGSAGLDRPGESLRRRVLALVLEGVAAAARCPTRIAGSDAGGRLDADARLRHGRQGGRPRRPRAPTLLKMDLLAALTVDDGPVHPDLPLHGRLRHAGHADRGERAGRPDREHELPRAKQALMSDAMGTVAGAALGTSTVTSFIESAAGVEQGGRTGLTALVVAALFLVALFFTPIVAMVGNYPPITAPALVVVGSMMMRNVTKIDWANYAEACPLPDHRRHSADLFDRRRAGPGVHRLSGGQAAGRPGPRREMADVRDGPGAGGLLRAGAVARGLSTADVGQRLFPPGIQDRAANIEQGMPEAGISW